MSTIPSTIPVEARAGDTLEFEVAFEGYSAADSWALSFTLLNSAHRYTFSTSADGGSFKAAVTASTTQTWAVGKYKLVGRASLAGVVVTLYEGDITILPDLGAAADLRTHEEKVLDAINGFLEGRSDVQEYALGGRSLKKMPIADLLKWQATYASRVRAQRIRRGEVLPSTSIGVTFRRPS